METSTMIVIAALAIGAFVAWIMYDQHRTKQLREQFGPEYDRTVLEFGNRRRAELELARREVYGRKMRQRALAPADQQRFQAKWRMCQSQFVDDPAGAVACADELVAEIMVARGYSTQNSYDRVTDIAAAYPHDVQGYRTANRIMADYQRGTASTSELRTAFLNYRTLFDDLLEAQGVEDETFKRAS